MSDQTLSGRVASALVRESGAVVVFVMLALPMLLLLQLLFPDSVGFYLVALVGATGHVTLRRMSEHNHSVETDISEIERKQALMLVAILAVVAVMTVSVRLGVGVVAGKVITGFAGKSLLTIFGAATAPMFDYLLGKHYPLLAPSTLAAIGLIELLATFAERVSPDAADSIRTDARHVDPM